MRRMARIAKRITFVRDDLVRRVPRLHVLPMSPDDGQQQKIIAKGVTEGILKAVGILVLLGGAVGVIVGLGQIDFSPSVSSAPPGMPAAILLVNETADSLVFELRSDTGVVSRHVIAPTKGTTCERFRVPLTPGKRTRAAFEIRASSGQRDTSGWFAVNVVGAPPFAWVDTVRPGRRQGAIRRIRDLNVLSSAECSVY